MQLDLHCHGNDLHIFVLVKMDRIAAARYIQNVLVQANNKFDMNLKETRRILRTNDKAKINDNAIPTFRPSVLHYIFLLLF